MPFKETKEGQTHSFNDGCGEPEHNEMKHTEKPEEWEEYWCQEGGDIYYTGDDRFDIGPKQALKNLLARQKEESYEQGRKDELERVSKLVEYVSHTTKCILNQFESGEAITGGKYRQKYAGVWYMETPKCDCGLTDLLATLNSGINSDKK